MIGNRFEMEQKIKTDARLETAMSFIRNGAVVADIGTDHGYIPIYLVKNRLSPFAYAADVNVQPLEKAKTNAEKYGVGDKISFHLSDGLHFIDEGKTDPEYPVSDIVICGMGGELIAKIIGESEYAKQGGITLILQPMSRADKLRKYLAENGFGVLGERLCTAAGKIYTVICAEYDGAERTLSEAEAILGMCASDRNKRLAREYFRSVLKKQKIKIAGLKNGGSDELTSEEKKLYRELKRTFRRGGRRRKDKQK